MDARNIGYWLQRIYHDLAGSTMVYMDARKDEYWLQQIYKELTGVDLVGDQRSFDWWSEAIYRHIIGDSGTVKGTVPAHVSWQLIYASRAGAAYPDGSSALGVEFWIQQVQRIGLESSAPIVTPWYALAGVTPVAAYQPKGASSLADSYINLVNPGTFNAAPGVAPAWNTATGWTGNGATTFLTTGIVHAEGWSIIVQFTGGATIANEALCGGESAGQTRLVIYPRLDLVAANRVVYGGGNFLGVAPQATAGNLCVAGQRGYRNGVADGAAIGAWSGANTREIYLLAANSDGVLFVPTAATVIAVAIYSVTLTAGQVLITANAMAAL